ncbi:DUF7527 domain-containing protein [Halomarina ordinaria]|uniref:DUF7527 domain-containing protein n=1 Tax=Halomarina ordinaria TaxID=3033939 RepID=A0ABD5U674_9EURY|nr:hypothetical protein [Halomarina sp. PSRA2]
MHQRTVDQIREWESRPVSGADLPDLAAASFTGAVEAGGTWLFLLNGRAVGVYGGTVEDVAASEGTAYAAPDPAFPLLFTMLERDGDRRGRYYTADTPLDEVDETLREGGFTGYVELSENVLSGDYYRLYYGGDAMSVAFVGQSERPLVGEEAFERASEEVGVYTVVAASVPVLDLPEASDAGTDVGADAGRDGGDAEPLTAAVPDRPEREERADSRSRGRTLPGAERADDPPAGPTAVGSDAPEGTDRPDALDADDRTTATARGSDEGTGEDPTPTEVPDDLASAVRRHGEGRAPGDTGPGSRERPAVDGGEDRVSGEVPDDPEALRSALDERETERQRLAGRVDDLLDARADLREENEALREEVATLREEVDRLEAEIDRLEARLAEVTADADAAASTVDRTPEEALAGTNLFVRYHSRGAMTLDDVRDGYDDQDGLRANLDLEHHTRFDAETTRVEGRPFAEFLEGTLAYEFVQWVVLDLPFELIDTGHVDALEGLYDAIPDIDRAELDGTVDLEEASPTFDVVCRDRLGNPLLVVDFHDARDPAGEVAVDDLLAGAERVAEAYDTLVGAFVVASSFFDPRALELASEATASGGLFGGGRRASFVRLSRKRGFHLCLVEARERRFHLTVPEL